MIKKTVSLLLAALLFYTSVYPCTTFVLKTNDGIYFGRNLDWVSDHGIVVINQLNLLKSSFVFPPEKSISWTSKYGSVSFNQFGKEFPFGGINEKGLVVEIMVSEAQYPPADERPMVNELQWVQYQLDNCASIDEVIASDAILRIGQATEGLHYLICDAEGNTAVIEFLGGKMVAYSGNKLPVSVLENSPYDESLRNYRNNQSCRFKTAAHLVEKYNGAKPAVDYSFNILEQVALTAEWSMVYDISKRQIHFKTSSNDKIRMVDMNSFDFACRTSSLSYDLGETDKGNISSNFVELVQKKNTEILKLALNMNKPTLKQSEREQVFRYFNETKCRN